ncbi:signal peptide-containing protein [Theileria equi strain WA]|uniref:Signal peptide-containing protein n=1 Tax=Theileria equi strain WA TaxID=1537102 RepID=L0B0V7_THEEQ|nr:signal peptide-containing protein [Theileria equi strain WA]AFZ81440.1 signal peptide-containing protein [Theileria equi strain WA]|eukprot:XP_004831106.1 signal peptide-containing protein [Theileria equi strain WA]
MSAIIRQIILFLIISRLGCCGDSSDKSSRMLVKLDISNIGNLVYISHKAEPPISRTIYYLKKDDTFISIADSGVIIWEAYGGEVAVDVVVYSKDSIPLLITLLIQDCAQFKYVHFEKAETWKQISKETYIEKLVELRTS